MNALKRSKNSAKTFEKSFWRKLKETYLGPPVKIL